MHPYLGMGYNRASAWKAMGFTDCLFLKDFQNADTVRDLVSDHALFDRICCEIKDTDAPLFCFAVTMQNHATYNNEVDQNIHVTDWDAGKELDNYLSLENISDKALEDFIEQLKNSEEETYVLFFGDHQPMVSTWYYEKLLRKKKNDFTDEDKRSMYKIPYFLWNNKDKKCLVPEETSMNYLPQVLLENIGFEDSWFSYTTIIQEQYPVLSDCYFKTKREWYQTKLKSVLKKVHNNISDPLSLLKQYQVYCYEIINREK